VGLFNFKGFNKEQELFCLSFSGNKNFINTIDKMISASIQFSINEGKLKKREWDYLWDNLGSMAAEIFAKIDDEKFKILLGKLDKNNIASIMNFLKSGEKQRILKTISGKDSDLIKFIQKRGCGAASDEYLSWFGEIITAAREIDEDLVEAALGRLKTEDRDKIAQYLSKDQSVKKRAHRH
jgi:hypothetical protein